MVNNIPSSAFYTNMLFFSRNRPKLYSPASKRVDVTNNKKNRLKYFSHSFDHFFKQRIVRRSPLRTTTTSSSVASLLCCSGERKYFFLFFYIFIILVYDLAMQGRNNGEKSEANNNCLDGEKKSKTARYGREEFFDAVAVLLFGGVSRNSPFTFKITLEMKSCCYSKSGFQRCITSIALL